MNLFVVTAILVVLTIMWLLPYTNKYANAGCGPDELFMPGETGVLGGHIGGGRCVKVPSSPPPPLPSCYPGNVLYQDIDSDGHINGGRCVSPASWSRPLPPLCPSNEYLDSGRCVPIPTAPPPATKPECASGDHMFFGRCIPDRLEFANTETMVKCGPTEAKVGVIKNRMGKIVAEECVPFVNQ